MSIVGLKVWVYAKKEEIMKLMYLGESDTVSINIEYVFEH